MPGQMEGQMEGWTDRQTLFYRTLPATAGGPIKRVLMTKLMVVVITEVLVTITIVIAVIDRITWKENKLDLNKKLVK